MTEDTSTATPAEPDYATLLDTTIREPSMTAGEVEMLLFALERSRAQFAWKCGGLDAAGLRKAHPPSAMTLGSLLKHLALVEESPNLRRVLVDLHDEYARHVGHADLLREAVDGLVGEDPPPTSPAPFK
jgi:hypothetical protein